MLMLTPVVWRRCSGQLTRTDEHRPIGWRRRAAHQRWTDDKQVSSSRQHTPSDWRVALASICVSSAYKWWDIGSGVYPPWEHEALLPQPPSDFYAAADSQWVTLLGLLDLSPAFDCVDHNILVHWLQLLYGWRGSFRFSLTAHSDVHSLIETYIYVLRLISSPRFALNARNSLQS